MSVNCSKNVHINLAAFFERELAYLISTHGFHRRPLLLGFIKGKKKTSEGGGQVKYLSSPAITYNCITCLLSSIDRGRVLGLGHA